MRQIEKIIVHCSASDRPKDDSPEAIKRLHMSTRMMKWGEYRVQGFNWSDIGYHFIITKDGKIHPGRSLNITGAHVLGHNHDSIGICLTGSHDFTKEQFESLEWLLRDLCFNFGLNVKDIYHHKDFDNKKTCPNFEISKKVDLSKIEAS